MCLVFIYLFRLCGAQLCLVFEEDDQAFLVDDVSGTRESVCSISSADGPGSTIFSPKIRMLQFVDNTITIAFDGTILVKKPLHLEGTLLKMRDIQSRMPKFDGRHVLTEGMCNRLFRVQTERRTCHFLMLVGCVKVFDTVEDDVYHMYFAFSKPPPYLSYLSSYKKREKNVHQENVQARICLVPCRNIEVQKENFFVATHVWTQTENYGSWTGMASNGKCYGMSGKFIDYYRQKYAYTFVTYGIVSIVFAILIVIIIATYMKTFVRLREAHVIEKRKNWLLVKGTKKKIVVVYKVYRNNRVAEFERMIRGRLNNGKKRKIENEIEMVRCPELAQILGKPARTKIPVAETEELLMDLDSYAQIVNGKAGLLDPEIQKKIMQFFQTTTQSLKEKTLEFILVVDVLQKLSHEIEHCHKRGIIINNLSPKNIAITTLREVYILDYLSAHDMTYGVCLSRELVGCTLDNAGFRSPELTTFENNRMVEDGIHSGHCKKLTPESRTVTEASDFFSLSMLFYYVLTSIVPCQDRNIAHSIQTIGMSQTLRMHPECRVTIEDCIAKNQEEVPRFEVLDREARNLVIYIYKYRTKREICNVSQILKHPFFWSPEKRCSFIVALSEQIELSARGEGREDLINSADHYTWQIFRHDWSAVLDKELVELTSGGRFKTRYDVGSLRGLLRFFRNCYVHYTELPDPVKRIFEKNGEFPKCYINYFISLYPNLLIKTYLCAKSTCSIKPIVGLSFFLS